MASPSHSAPRLQGHAGDSAHPQPKARGWHPVDWLCEAGGTAFQLFFGFCLVALFEAQASPLRDALPDWSRLILIGSGFGLLAGAVALSPLGRRSGAHLNPAVTLGFVLRGHTPWRDALGYAVGQIVGALLAAIGFAAALGSWAASVSGARTIPQPGLPLWAAAIIESALTFALLTSIFLMLSSKRTSPWTPAAVVPVVAALIWVGAPHTGASMNPARTLGPDIAGGVFPALWVYFLGPPVGATLAALLFETITGRKTLSGKLFHDPRYPSVHATALPARAHRRGSGQRR